MTYNEAMREARINAGLTQKEVAEAVNVAQPTVARFENGTKPPSIGMLVSLAKLYNVSVDKLIGIGN